MRVTKAVIAAVCNDYFKRVEMPYTVNVSDIEHTRFRTGDYEGGATFHYIIAKNEDSEYGNIEIYTMDTFKGMQEELKKFPDKKLMIKNYSRNTFILDFWVVVN